MYPRRLLETRRILFVFVASFLMLFGSVTLADDAASLPVPGPARSGLQLRLQIVSTPQQGGYNVRLELLNSGKEAVTLEARSFYEDKRDYAEYLQETTRFSSYPHVLPSVFSTSGQFRSSPQPQHTLAPGASLVRKWSTPNDKQIGGGFHTHESLEFPKDGTFLVRAHVTVHTDAGEPIKLWSNEQPFCVGGVKEAPTACAARVLGVDSGTQLGLDVGRDDGIKVGDKFTVGHPKTAYFKLEVIKVDERYCVAKFADAGSYGETGQKAPRPGDDARFVK